MLVPYHKIQVITEIAFKTTIHLRAIHFSSLASLILSPHLSLHTPVFSHFWHLSDWIWTLIWIWTNPPLFSSPRPMITFDPSSPWTRLLFTSHPFVGWHSCMLISCVCLCLPSQKEYLMGSSSSLRPYLPFYHSDFPISCPKKCSLIILMTVESNISDNKETFSYLRYGPQMKYNS